MHASGYKLGVKWKKEEANPVRWSSVPSFGLYKWLNHNNTLRGSTSTVTPILRVSRLLMGHNGYTAPAAGPAVRLRPSRTPKKILWLTELNHSIVKLPTLGKVLSIPTWPYLIEDLGHHHHHLMDREEDQNFHRSTVFDKTAAITSTGLQPLL